MSARVRKGGGGGGGGGVELMLAVAEGGINVSLILQQLPLFLSLKRGFARHQAFFFSPRAIDSEM